MPQLTILLSEDDHDFRRRVDGARQSLKLSRSRPQILLKTENEQHRNGVRALRQRATCNLYFEYLAA